MLFVDRKPMTNNMMRHWPDNWCDYIGQSHKEPQAPGVCYGTSVYEVRLEREYVYV